MTVKIQNIDGFFMSDPVRDPDRSTPAGIGGYIDEGCTSCIGGFVTVIHNEIDFGGPGKFPSCDTHFGGAVPADLIVIEPVICIEFRLSVDLGQGRILKDFCFRESGIGNFAFIEVKDT